MERLHSASLRFRRQQQAPTESAWDRTIQDQTLVTEETRLHEFRLLCQTRAAVDSLSTYFSGCFYQGSIYEVEREGGTTKRGLVHLGWGAGEAAGTPMARWLNAQQPTLQPSLVVQAV
jgi:hypothetical protein